MKLSGGSGVEEVFSRDAFALRWVGEQTTELCLAAVKQERRASSFTKICNNVNIFNNEFNGGNIL